MKIIYRSILSLTPIFLMAVPAFAQGTPPQTPIDGGLSLLLAAGGVYGLKKLRDHRKIN
ncbi:MAG: hypothetical protein JXR10_07605 [Cyclobacteriaceae bacterium]